MTLFINLLKYSLGFLGSISEHQLELPQTNAFPALPSNFFTGQNKGRVVLPLSRSPIAMDLCRPSFMI